METVYISPKISSIPRNQRTLLRIPTDSSTYSSVESWPVSSRLGLEDWRSLRWGIRNFDTILSLIKSSLPPCLLSSRTCRLIRNTSYLSSAKSSFLFIYLLHLHCAVYNEFNIIWWCPYINHPMHQSIISVWQDWYYVCMDCISIGTGLYYIYKLLVLFIPYSLFTIRRSIISRIFSQSSIADSFLAILVTPLYSGPVWPSFHLHVFFATFWTLLEIFTVLLIEPSMYTVSELSKMRWGSTKWWHQSGFIFWRFIGVFESWGAEFNPDPPVNSNPGCIT